MSEATRSYSRVSVHVGSHWRVRCIPVTSQPPLLDIDAGETEISIGLTGQEIRASAVEFAAELARETARFAAEVERRSASRPAPRTARPPIRRPDPAQVRRGGWSWYLQPPPVSPHVRHEAERTPIVCVPAGEAR